MLRGRCVPGRPYAALAPIVQSALSLASVHDELDGALACAPGCHARWWEHSTAEDVVRLHRDAPLARRESLHAERRVRFVDAIRMVVERASERGTLLLVLDDVEHVDHGTAEVLRAWLEPRVDAETPSKPAIVVLGTTSRASTDGGALATLIQAPRAITCEAGRFDASALASWLAEPEIATWITARTGGRVRSLERWLTTAADPAPEPVARAEAPDARSGVALALGVTRAIGRSVPLAALLSEPRDRAVLERDLERLGALARDRDGAPAVAWPRPAPMLDGAVQGAVHAHAARALERMGAIEEAAWHASRSDDVMLHVRLALAAEPALSARHGAREAADLLTAARARLDDDAAQRVVLDARLARVWSTLGESERAIESARAVCERAPHDLAVRLRCGEILLRAGRHAEAITCFEAVTVGAATREHVEARVLAAEARYTTGDLAGAERDARHALADASAQDHVALRIDAQNVLGKIALATGDTRAARAWFGDDLALSLAGALRTHECVARQNLAIVLMREGALDDAATHFEVSSELARSVGAAWHRAIALENLGVLHHLRGRWSAARRCYRESAAILEPIGHRDWLARLLLNRASLELTLGDPASARELVQRARRVVGDEPRRAFARRATLVDGAVLLALGDVEHARDLFEMVRSGEGEPSSLAEGALGVARCALELGDVALARRALHDASRTSTSPRLECERQELEVLLAIATGGPAASLARAARELATRTEHVEVELRVWCHLARAQLADGALDCARTSLERAGELEARVTEHVPEDSRELFAKRTDARALHSLRERAWGARPQPSSTAATRIIVGGSRAIDRLRRSIERVAGSDAQVLVLGESGTGKELVAEALHRLSPRARGPLVRVNCAALTESLLLSELFGHERGAFTGASARKLGLFETAQGGTLFLDEIGDISPPTQVALLRVLQERTIVRVGGTTPIRVDVRVVAATHRRLEQLVERGAMREDLYYRLRGIVLEVPALRDRIDDLPAIADALLARIARDERAAPKRLSPAATARMRAHRWPGNVRELENVLRAASVLAPGATLEIDDVAPHLVAPQHVSPQHGAPSDPSTESGELETLYWASLGDGHSVYELRRSLERRAIERAIDEAGGNLSQAAQRLGMKRPRLSQLAKEYGLRKRSS
ncbi:sigma 54-interacting transcriptional regulator [Sandaracinus amylolyticus]|uniref:sigma 54-interacting transcriptional regulator n=1 Tax=Sandaracinus amylolyticus TaxID=927083 RepID=UPI0012ED995E|nr:sigma 54-interacting transcriptional regulator [Sandaracinus amylolyticus]